VLVNNLRLANLSLTTAQQRSTGQNLPVDLYFIFSTRMLNRLRKNIHRLSSRLTKHPPFPLTFEEERRVELQEHAKTRVLVTMYGILFCPVYKDCSGPIHHARDPNECVSLN
jgi:hypothetical protein